MLQLRTQSECSSMSEINKMDAVMFFVDCPFLRFLINIILIDICKDTTCMINTISGQGYKQIVLPTKDYISCNLLLT
jgi:hypothetical protein